MNITQFYLDFEVMVLKIGHFLSVAVTNFAILQVYI